MSDPISGVGGGAAKIAMQQLQQMQNQQQIQKPPMQSGDSSSFANKMQQNQEVQQSQKVSEVQKTSQSIRPASIQATPQTQQSQRVNATQKSDSTRFEKLGQNKSSVGKGVASFLDKMDARKGSLDTLMKQAMEGKNFNNKQLLVLQYKVSTFSMEMDLTSKLVEKTTGGIKQAMNTQV